MTFKYEPPKTKTVILQCTDYDGVPRDTNDYYAYRGFEKLGHNVILKPYDFFKFQFDEQKIEFKESLPFEDLACVYGQIGFVKEILDLYDKPYFDSDDYPEELSSQFKFMNRHVQKRILKDVLSDIELELKTQDTLDTGLFIKSVKAKLFYGMAIRNKVDFNNFKIMSLRNPSINLDTEQCYVCEAITIVSEWRNYVLEGKLIDSKHYRGTHRIHPDYDVIDNMIDTYKFPPVAYALDTGITDTGDTVLVEVNRMDSLGNYGLEETDFASMLEAHWNETFNKKI